jgi:hypothetical protein
VDQEEVYIWVEAELFDDYGGWKLDTQFIEHMGSAYLLAQGLDGPVADATAEVNIERGGQYHVFSRTKNWIPDFSPGRFKIAVAGTELPNELGTRPEEGWLWQKAGEVALQPGSIDIALRDLTGEYGRCDAVLLTTDAGFVPPDRGEELGKLREELFGVSQEPKDMGAYDFVVVGGGIAGTIAALVAARHENKVALIQNRSVLGGNASPEIDVGVCGAPICDHRHARESGLREELTREAARLREPGRLVGGWHEALRAACEAESDLDLFLNTEGTGVMMKDATTIDAVTAVHTLTGERYVFHGKVFADTTGDADIGAAAGAEFRRGREGREVYGEDLAPDFSDEVTLGTTLPYFSEDAGEPNIFHAPDWACSVTESDLLFKVTTFGWFWWLEVGHRKDTIQDEEEIRDEALRAVYGLWDYIKNSCTTLPADRDPTNRRLSWVGHVAGKRESRRLIGDYVLTEQDLENGTFFSDAVAYGGWPIDLHLPGEGIGNGCMAIVGTHIWQCVDLYNIPFRSLYSRNINNLMMAGRNVSVSHVALGSTRVMGTTATLGQAIGTAAALCNKHDTTPRGVYRSHLAALQQALLRDDAYIIDVRNEDPDDLARTATVTASSVASAAYDPASQEHTGQSHEMTCHRAQMFPTTMTDLQSVSAWLVFAADGTSPMSPLQMTAHLRKANGPNDFSSAVDIMTTTVSITPQTEHWVQWVDFQFAIPVEENAYYWLFLERPSATDGKVYWYLVSTAPPGVWRAYSVGGTDWTVGPAGETYGLVTTPPVTTGDNRAENVNNGIARPVGIENNMWVSDPKQPLPQWLQLDLIKSSNVNLIQITFNTDLTPGIPGSHIAQQTVRDYEVNVRVAGKWLNVASVTGNYQRLRRHRFNTVTADAVRIVVNATNGDSSVEIFEVRMYND